MLNASQEKAPTQPVDVDLVGVGGWLLLVVLGLIVSPLRITYFLATIHWPIFRDGVWEQLTTVGAPGYHHLWAPLLIFEVVANLASIALAVATPILLLRHSRRTPGVAIV